MKKDLESLADAAHEALGESGDADDDALRAAWRIQLRKACWFLGAAAAMQLDEDDPQSSVAVVELSLATIERSLQAALMREHRYEAEDFHRHGFAIEEAGQRGIISDDLAATLASIWKDVRNENYYRDGIPTIDGARKVRTLAARLHAQLTRRNAASRGVCTCPKPR